MLMLPFNTPQTHEEVLRLLLAAALPTPDGKPPLLTPNEVDAYLGVTLENSKKSRKRYGAHDVSFGCCTWWAVLA